MFESNVSSFDKLHEVWEEVLDIEALNRRFYKELFSWYTLAVNTCIFPGKQRDDDTQKRNVIRLITRLLFIWFLKEKGLVPEELFCDEFLSNVIKDHDPNSSHYYRVVLQNLFFATLNTEMDKRYLANNISSSNNQFNQFRHVELLTDSKKLFELFTSVPFVNGGLFDYYEEFQSKSENEKSLSNQNFNIPASLFLDPDVGLFALFRRYKFTVEESTPIDQEVALDPELLGRVFENLLATYNPETRESARKNTGSFYTPRKIVDLMVHEVLVDALARETNPSDNDQVFWKERLSYLVDYSNASSDADDFFDVNEKKSIISRITTLRVLDPAVGSGAFAMGILQRMVLVLNRLDPDHIIWNEIDFNTKISSFQSNSDSNYYRDSNKYSPEISKIKPNQLSSDYLRKLYLVENCIFGVDIQAIACQITKLRFFISLVIEQTSDCELPNLGISPLPNLESNFVAADSLKKLRSSGRQAEISTNEIRQLEEKLKENRKAYFHVKNNTEKNRLREENINLRHSLSDELQKFGLSTSSAKRLREWDPFSQYASSSWFNSEYMFGIVGGFDIVIGNPPYIQLQKNDGELGNRYSNEHYVSFEQSGDIYVLFLEQGIDQLKKGGVLCFIVSNKWMRANYGKKLRNFIHQFDIPVVLDFSGMRIFESATVDPCIIKIINSQNKFKTVAASFSDSLADFRESIENSENILVSSSTGPWFICNNSSYKLKEKIESKGLPLHHKTWGISIYRGIVTGLNAAFVIDNDTRISLIEEDSSSEILIRKILRGEDIKPFRTTENTKWLIDCHNGYGDVEPVNVDSFPAIKRHLDYFYDRLSVRLDKGVTPYNLRSCNYYEEFEKEKIVWSPYMTSRTSVRAIR